MTNTKQELWDELEFERIYSNDIPDAAKLDQTRLCKYTEKLRNSSKMTQLDIMRVSKLIKCAYAIGLKVGKEED